jgi:hypothetical protein
MILENENEEMAQRTRELEAQLNITRGECEEALEKCVSLYLCVSMFLVLRLLVRLFFAVVMSFIFLFFYVSGVKSLACSFKIFERCLLTQTRDT